MYDITRVNELLRQIREGAALSQREFASAAGTSQSAVANLEQGLANPTVETLARLLRAAGYAMVVDAIPLPGTDRVVERYKVDVDRTLIRENLKKSVNERVRSLAEWQAAGAELERAARTAKRRK
ncbi:MAG TPA: helix-turn-helix transcriptional regulator [Gemmatimonadaceae bacterium]|nr:helix-turn-helix transcriptional regulator [Gemmatimonadaceae bacterium]